MTDSVDRIVRSPTDSARSAPLAEIAKDWLKNYPAETMPDGVIVIYANESGGEPIAYIYPAEDGLVRVNVDGVDYYISEDEIYPRSRPARRRAIEVATETEEVSEEIPIQESLPPEDEVCRDDGSDMFTSDSDPHHDYVNQMSVPDGDLNSTQNSAGRFVEYLCWEDEARGESGCVPIESREDEVARESSYRVLEGEIPVNIDLADPANPEIYVVRARRPEEEVTTESSAVVVEERPPDAQPEVQAGQSGTATAENEAVVESSDPDQSETDGTYGSLTTEFAEPGTQNAIASPIEFELAPASVPTITTSEIAAAYSVMPANLSAMSVDPEGQSSRAIGELAPVGAVMCYHDLPLQTSVGFNDFSTPPMPSGGIKTAGMTGEKIDSKFSFDRDSQSHSDSNRTFAATDGALRQARDQARSDGLRSDAAFRQTHGAAGSQTTHERIVSKSASGEKILPDANSDAIAIAAAAPQGAPFVPAAYASKGHTPVELREGREQVARAGRDEQGHGRGQHDKDSDSREKRDEWWFVDLEDPENPESEEIAYS